MRHHPDEGAFECIILFGFLLVLFPLGMKLLAFESSNRFVTASRRGAVGNIGGAAVMSDTSVSWLQTYLRDCRGVLSKIARALNAINALGAGRLSSDVRSKRGVC